MPSLSRQTTPEALQQESHFILRLSLRLSVRELALHFVTHARHILIAPARHAICCRGPVSTPERGGLEHVCTHSRPRAPATLPKILHFSQHCGNAPLLEQLKVSHSRKSSPPHVPASQVVAAAAVAQTPTARPARGAAGNPHGADVYVPSSSTSSGPAACTSFSTASSPSATPSCAL